MIIRKFAADDLARLVIQPEQADEYLCVRKVKFDFTIEHKGIVLGVFALLQTEKRRICLASFISRSAGIYMIAFVKLLKAVLEEGMAKTGNETADMTVRSDFENGKRLARILCFEFNQILPGYFQGRDYLLYTRRLK